MSRSDRLINRYKNRYVRMFFCAQPVGGGL